jgi:hypothetical protein
MRLKMGLRMERGTGGGGGGGGSGAFGSMNAIMMYLTADKAVSSQGVAGSIEWDAGIEYGSAVLADWWSASPNPERLVVPSGVTKARATGVWRLQNDNRFGGYYGLVRCTQSGVSSLRPLIGTHPEAVGTGLGTADTVVFDGPWIEVSAGDYFELQIYSAWSRGNANANGTWVMVEFE